LRSNAPRHIITGWTRIPGRKQRRIQEKHEVPLTAHDNLAEYDDPAIYDQETPSFEPDGPFYLALAQRFGGPVLELGCGTGRNTIPLARRGVDITGLDLAPRMLEHARRKAPDLPITWIESDVRSFHLGGRFRFIFESGATFQHLLARPDQEAMLARVREHISRPMDALW
jgi:SAM-dependent methyltransferase